MAKPIMYQRIGQSIMSMEGVRKERALDAWKPNRTMKIHARATLIYVVPILFTFVRRRQRTAVNGKVLHDGDTLMPFCLPETQQIRGSSLTHVHARVGARAFWYLRNAEADLGCLASPYPNTYTFPSCPPV
jgi:hypothetical protein